MCLLDTHRSRYDSLVPYTLAPDADSKNRWKGLGHFIQRTYEDP